MSPVAAAPPAFAVRGWCPGALRPMMSGDGLVVRVKPRLGRFTQDQAMGIARAALAHGSGVLDLTSRANLQIRGVRADAHPALIAELDMLGLVDASEAVEARRNITVTPFADEAVLRAAQVVENVLPILPPLPGKFGFAVDCAAQRVLTDVSADIRVESSDCGTLLVRADGMEKGWPTDEARLPDVIAILVKGFVALRGKEHDPGRMAQVSRALLCDGNPLFADLGSPSLAPGPAAQAPDPGLSLQGALVGFAFGQTDTATLAALATLGPIRLTPWRMVLVEGLTRMPDLPGLITDAADPLRRVVACTGAPGCPQGLAPTRPFARALAAAVPAGKSLHVSGCAKGCAHPGVAEVTLVASADGFHVISNGTARNASTLPVLTAQTFSNDHNLIRGLF